MDWNVQRPGWFYTYEILDLFHYSIPFCEIASAGKLFSTLLFLRTLQSNTRHKVGSVVNMQTKNCYSNSHFSHCKLFIFQLTIHQISPAQRLVATWFYYRNCTIIGGMVSDGCSWTAQQLLYRRSKMSCHLVLFQDCSCASTDLIMSWTPCSTCFVLWQHPLQILVKYHAVFLYISTIR